MINRGIVGVEAWLTGEGLVTHGTTEAREGIILVSEENIKNMRTILSIPDNSQLHQLRCGCKIFQVRGIFSILNATRTPV